jgi:FlaA1/EpsC-like NDP-sugar epimerase
VLIVGSHQDARYAAWILRQPVNAQKFQVFGFVDNNLFAQGMRVHGAKVVGTHSDIVKLVTQHDINVVILADHEITQDQRRSIAEVCRVTNARFVLMPNIIDSLSDLCTDSFSTGEAGGQVNDGADSGLSEGMAGRGAAPVAPQW